MQQTIAADRSITKQQHQQQDEDDDDEKDDDDDDDDDSDGDCINLQQQQQQQSNSSLNCSVNDSRLYDIVGGLFYLTHHVYYDSHDDNIHIETVECCDGKGTEIFSELEKHRDFTDCFCLTSLDKSYATRMSSEKVDLQLLRDKCSEVEGLKEFLEGMAPAFLFSSSERQGDEYEIYQQTKEKGEVNDIIDYRDNKPEAELICKYSLFPYSTFLVGIDVCACLLVEMKEVFNSDEFDFSKMTASFTCWIER